MTLSAFTLIFISVFMHAAWNFISKKSNPNLAFYLVLSAVAALPFFIIGCFCGINILHLSQRFWIYFLASNVFECIYAAGLCYAYRKSDISLVYPMGRALPVLFTMLITAVCAYGKPLSWTAVSGMVMIFTGCVFMVQKDFKSFNFKAYLSPVLFYILLMACGTTGYTLCDSVALEEMPHVANFGGLGHSLLFVAFIYVSLTVSLLFIVLLIPHERKSLPQLLRHPGQAVGAGLLNASAYFLVLIAMEKVTNVSYVQAFRQMSLPIGVLAGVFILKEKCQPPKTVGIILIVSALIILCLFK